MDSVVKRLPWCCQPLSLSWVCLRAVSNTNMGALAQAIFIRRCHPHWGINNSIGWSSKTISKYGSSWVIIQAGYNVSHLFEPPATVGHSPDLRGIYPSPRSTRCFCSVRGPAKFLQQLLQDGPGMPMIMVPLGWLMETPTDIYGLQVTMIYNEWYTMIVSEGFPSVSCNLSSKHFWHLCFLNSLAETCQGHNWWGRSLFKHIQTTKRPSLDGKFMAAKAWQEICHLPAFAKLWDLALKHVGTPCGTSKTRDESFSGTIDVGGILTTVWTLTRVQLDTS